MMQRLPERRKTKQTAWGGQCLASFPPLFSFLQLQGLLTAHCLPSPPPPSLCWECIRQPSLPGQSHKMQWRERERERENGQQKSELICACARVRVRAQRQKRDAPTFSPQVDTNWTVSGQLRSSYCSDPPLNLSFSLRDVTIDLVLPPVSVFCLLF